MVNIHTKKVHPFLGGRGAQAPYPNKLTNYPNHRTVTSFSYQEKGTEENSGTGSKDGPFPKLSELNLL